MTKRNENVSNANNSTITNTESHETGYQLIDGVVITPELLQRISVMQDDCNDGITIWEARAMRLIISFMTYADGNLEDADKMEHVWTICNLVSFMETMQAPDEYLVKMIREERSGR